MNTNKSVLLFPVTVILIIALLVGVATFSSKILSVKAATLTSVSDTLTDSRPSVVSGHTINFTTATTTTAGQQIKIQFDPTGDLFTLTGVTTTTADIATTGMTFVTACTGAASEVTGTIDATAPDENLTLTVCSGDSLAAGAKVVAINGTNKITNPAATGSYIIRIAGTQADSGDTRVAIVDAVTVTASVDTSLTFVISPIASGVAINGDAVTTSAGATTTTLPFGTLAPGVAKVLGQSLSVTTNAANGFIVTLQQNQNLLASTGADIDLFKDGVTSTTPVAWTAPLGTLDTERTYGHYGVTSEDADLNTDEFGTALYVGNIENARTVFSHNGPADGTTANKGFTRIGVKIEVTALQEAGTDYTNRLMYIATPTF